MTKIYESGDDHQVVRTYDLKELLSPDHLGRVYFRFEESLSEVEIMIYSCLKFDLTLLLWFTMCLTLYLLFKSRPYHL